MQEDVQIRFFDTTLRDGEQAPGYSMNLDEKVRMALQLETLGVDVIEAGFAIASPGDAEAVAAIARSVKGAAIASLSRALEKDIDASARALREAAHPRIHTFIATSDLHLQYKLKLTREEALDQARRMVAYARNLCAEVEFSAEDAFRTDLDYLCRVTEAVIDAGATVVNLPDTVGYATPNEFYEMVHAVHTRVPNMHKAILAVHCHNDLGLGVANSLAGIRAGARQVECTIGGIGERAGNAALEEIVMTLRTRADHFGCSYNIRTEELYRTARLLASITGIKIAPNKPIVGQNAFSHESGIHQHGMMADSRTYEIMTPESVGVLKTSLVLGKHSGQHAFRKRLNELGYRPTDEEMSGLFESFKVLADRKKTIEDRDLVALMESALAVGADPKKMWMLDSFVVNSGNRMISTACVSLRKGKKKYREVAMGAGPVNASLKAIEKIIRHPFVLEDYRLQAVTEGREALGEVLVKISDETGFYRGRGVSTDVIEASILSCLVAVNHMLDENTAASALGAATAARERTGRTPPTGTLAESRMAEE
ncbi:MAG: 2-isopropylmalate synthase [Lentisphaerae bacterium]|jgi:2-isopropylmalate synthase|nr:2-isopropylmalate synthase [Lentisphaerota bacterium]